MSVNFSSPVFWVGGTRFLNDTNDTVVGQAITALPAGVQSNQGNQNVPGNRAILDAATALALSNTTVGTLFSGVYQYVLTNSAGTVVPARGKAAFWVPLSTTVLETQYLTSSDAAPSTAVPTQLAGVFINAITKGNYGWIQISGLASCLFDSALTATADGNWVTVKVSASVTSTFDVGAVAGVVTLAAQVGVALAAPSTSTISKVLITRGISRW